jgi:outer membrane protein TolC
MKHALLLAACASLAAAQIQAAPNPAPAEAASSPVAASASATKAAQPSWPSTPLTRDQCLDLALTWNANLLKGRQDIQESHGIALQQSSARLPRLGATGAYNKIDEGKIEKVAFAPGTAPVSFANDENWNATITASQPIFAGGKLRSAARSSKLTKEAALANYQTLVASTLLDVRVAYDDVLLATEQIGVQEASIKLLEQELADTRRRFDAGTVPRFNVLRAEVELANSKPRLIRARNALRIARNNLAVLLGFNVPRNADQDIPLETSDKLAAVPSDVGLQDALAKAIAQRPELVALRTAGKLRDEEVIQARADYYPQLSAVAGYGWQAKNFNRDLSSPLDGWNVGAQLSWNFWDAGLTRGKVDAAKARRTKAQIDVDDTARRIELEVRTSHSNLIEAREVLDSQSKVIEQAEEALRLSVARSDAGTGTQLDVLSAQTALTEARNTYSVALRDFSVARARLDRAMGEGVRLTVSK